ncbi:MAG: ATP-binding protein [Chloroflexota bacterium]
MSLRWRILGAFITIIILTVLVTVFVAYWTARQNLAQLTSEFGAEEAKIMAQIISTEYTKTGGWETLDVIMFETGYLFNGVPIDSAFNLEEIPIDDFAIAGIAVAEYKSISPFRLIVLDQDRQILFDTAFQIEPGRTISGLESPNSNIIDLKSGEVVGTIFAEVNEAFFADESSSFVREAITTTTIGGLITAIVAILMAVWFSRRITAPITALTHATQALAEQKETELLPVDSSDELGRMSATFNQLTTALQTQRSLRKRLIDDISHELNTPLSVIQLEANGLRDEIQLPKDAATQIINEVQNLRNLVHDLNWLAETDSGELRLNTSKGDIAELLEVEVDRWQTQAHSQGVSLSLAPLPSLTQIEFDQVRLSQVVGNLLRNGLQHCQAGDQIEVSATIGARARPAKSKQFVCVNVKDSGAGIDPADLPHLFERFYRTDASRSRVSGGSGLGLSIARAIVEAHDGTITITSSGLGHGTLISFELPL